MNLWQLIQQYLNPMTDEERMKRAMMMNARAPRMPNGDLRQQGDWGIYSDSMPLTLEDHFRNNKPGFWRNLQEPVPTLTPRMERELMKKPPPYSGML